MIYLHWSELFVNFSFCAGAFGFVREDVVFEIFALGIVRPPLKKMFVLLSGEFLVASESYSAANRRWASDIPNQR